jgi:pimeloyl-ACP methyl ester carboxylesterase
MERKLGIESVQDAGRVIDYLETRTDVDTLKIAFVGVSFGAGLGLKIVAVEPRFKAAVLLSLGYTPAGGYGVVDSWNYAPRVTIPVRVISGTDDSMAPVETSQLPMFEALGSIDKDRRPHPGGHVDFVDKPEAINEMLEWLDLKLGNVTSAH